MKATLAAAAAATAKVSPWAALWTFPSILFSAFLVAWGAEAAQFLVSQGLALALLAWLQTLPEFAVEAVIAWEAGKDASRLHYAIANFTGSIRLLVGLGWPLVFFTAWFFARRKGVKSYQVEFDDEHSLEVMGMLPPLLWFTAIWWKGSLGLWDAGILSFCYFAYLFALSRLPPREGDIEEEEDLPIVSKKILRLTPGKRGAALAAVFLLGGGLLLASAHSFVESMLAVAIAAGIAPFVFVQWVAPFLSEFPEKLSAFNWARQVSKAPMAVMNLVSSTINQWSILSALLPVIYSISRGTPSALVFDAHQESEILLTLVQSYLAWLLLLNMNLQMKEAALLFVLWLVQFCVPSTRETMVFVYLGWCLLQIGLILYRPASFRAFRACWQLFRKPHAEA